MTTLATDDFNRADAANLGANWTVQGGGSGVAIRILSNVAHNTSGELGLEYYNATGSLTDQYAECDLVTVETTSDNGAGPAVRMASAAQTLYMIQSNTVETRLYKGVAGAFTQLGSDAAAGAVSDRFRIEAQGTSITAKKNGSTIIGPVTDNAIASGYAGLWISAPAIDTKVDNFEVGDFGAAAAANQGENLRSQTFMQMRR